MRMANAIILETYVCLTINKIWKMTLTRLTTEARIMNDDNPSSSIKIRDVEEKMRTS